MGHASLTSITLAFNLAPYNRVDAAGALLGALVAAHSQLRVLDVANNDLHDAGLGPLVDALPRNTHLRELKCVGNAISLAFERDMLMPALAANTSLQQLNSGSAKTDAFIAARTAAMTAASRA